MQLRQPAVQHAVLEARVVGLVVGVGLLGDPERGADHEPGVVDRGQPLHLFLGPERDLDQTPLVGRRPVETADDGLERGGARAHEVVVHERVVLALRLLLGRIEIGTRVEPVADLAVGRLLDDRHHVARRHGEQLDLLHVQRDHERAVSRPLERAPSHSVVLLHRRPQTEAVKTGDVGLALLARAARDDGPPLEMHLVGQPARLGA